MPRTGRYHEGVPCWVALRAPDVAAARRFYRELFGWDYVATGAAADGRLVATLQGVQVAGIEPGRKGERSTDAWTTYLRADRADPVAGRIREAGGRVLTEPFDVADQGRTAIAADPQGAVFGLWQGGLNDGSGLANEPGSFTWNELLCTDAALARAFYRRVFGYEYGAQPQAPADYAVVKVAGSPVGGIGALPGPYPPGTPPLWSTTFAVADADRTAALVGELGGEVLSPPQDTPFGRRAVVRDPGGAAFSLLAATGW
ncbi:VOC family protein [Kitasatospora sp. NPDC050543]|uniref:VOC family protein n=1 Tax=Kitasatospora sp. NPDC050543 TaxID=3364054 RepID=UPI0037930198